MDYFNDINNTGFYTTTTSGEFYAYPIETSVPGWVEVRIYETSPYGWGVGGWPDYPASSQVSPRAETGPFISHGPTHIFLESTSSVTSSGAQTQDYKHSSFPEGHQSAAGWDTQSSPSGVVGRGNYTVGSGTSAVVPVSDDRKSFFCTTLEGMQFSPTTNRPDRLWGSGSERVKWTLHGKSQP